MQQSVTPRAEQKIKVISAETAKALTSFKSSKSVRGPSKFILNHSAAVYKSSNPKHSPIKSNGQKSKQDGKKKVRYTSGFFEVEMGSEVSRQSNFNIAKSAT